MERSCSDPWWDLYLPIMVFRRTKTSRRSLQTGYIPTVYYTPAVVHGKGQENMKDLVPRYVLPLLAQLLAGFSTTELARLTAEVIASIEKEPLQTASVQGRIARTHRNR